MPVIPGGIEFQASLDYIERPYLKETKPTNQLNKQLTFLGKHPKGTEQAAYSILYNLHFTDEETKV
jgi:hypothetical protein